MHGRANHREEEEREPLGLGIYRCAPAAGGQEIVVRREHIEVLDLGAVVESVTVEAETEPLRVAPGRWRTGRARREEIRLRLRVGCAADEDEEHALDVVHLRGARPHGTTLV